MVDQRSQSVRRRRQSLREGFTLLEIMLAVAILVVITVVVSRFTELTVQSAEISARDTEEGIECNGLRHLLAAQFSALPANQDGALVGMNIKNHGQRRDAMQIVCPSGNGLLTPDAIGYYQVTMVLREIPRGSGKMVLGLERQPWSDDDDDDDDDDDTPSTAVAKSASVRSVLEKLPADWIPIMAGVQQLEIGYFDARLNSWVERWTDESMLPNLVRVRLTFAPGQPPYEIVERVPNGGLKRIQTLLETPTNTGPNPGAGVAPGAGTAPGGAGQSSVLR